MPELSISEDQREYLESLRGALAENVGPYGHVRQRDALQFLIDSHGDIGDVSPNAADGTGGESESDRGGRGQNGAEPAEDEAGSGRDEATDGETDDAGAEDEADDDADRLSSMMSLLDEHDGKWHRVEDDGTYEVDLPDGGTETVRTKDDVRAVLFKQY